MNSAIVNAFRHWIHQISYDIDKRHKSNDVYRLRQVSNALKIIQQFPTQIKHGSDLLGIKGIGKGIARRIDEILATGTLAEILIIPQDSTTQKAIDTLKKVYGIGDKTAEDLVINHKIFSVKDLLTSHAQGKIHLHNTILMGLKYYNVYQPQIPRSEMVDIEQYLTHTMRALNRYLRLVICGSYRRGLPVSNDIDCMLIHPKVHNLRNNKYFSKVLKYLKQNKFIVDSLTNDNVVSKFMGFCRLDSNHPVRRIDIRFVPYNSRYTALLYFTGSSTFNQSMRGYAKKMGYHLNEYGLFKHDTLIHVTSEKDIFTKLHMKYIPPVNRI
jgi:DNA polymerase/3'-5' exonuclease PolX